MKSESNMGICIFINICQGNLIFKMAFTFKDKMYNHKAGVSI